jgi:hypothetical protein
LGGAPFRCGSWSSSRRPHLPHREAGVTDAINNARRFR